MDTLDIFCSLQQCVWCNCIRTWIWVLYEGGLRRSSYTFTESMSSRDIAFDHTRGDEYLLDSDHHHHQDTEEEGWDGLSTKSKWLVEAKSEFIPYMEPGPAYDPASQHPCNWDHLLHIWYKFLLRVKTPTFNPLLCRKLLKIFAVLHASLYCSVPVRVGSLNR